MLCWIIRPIYWSFWIIVYYCNLFSKYILYISFYFLRSSIIKLLCLYKINPYNISFLFNFYVDWFNKLDSFNEIMSVGHILYTDYLVQFLLAGNILLLATIGPVVLVLTKSVKTNKFQITFKQLSRTYNSVLYT